MRKTLQHSIIAVTVSLAVTTSTPAPAVSPDKLIDLSIEAVDPGLVKYRPVLKCAVGGTPMDTCAKNAALGPLGKISGTMLDELYFAAHVYDMARDGDITGLVAALGVNATCTVLGEISAGSVICNKFAAPIIQTATELGKAGKSIAMTVGGAVVGSLNSAVTSVTCAAHVYCPEEDKDDPNKFNYHYAGGKLAIDKFDLETIWRQDYAPRLPEGVEARLSNSAQLERIIAVPPARAVTLMKPGAKALFLDSVALGSATINARVTGLLAVDKASQQKGLGGIPTTLLDVHAQAFVPFEHALNDRWLLEVNRTTGQLLESDAQRFLADSKTWTVQALPQIGLANFVPGGFHPVGWQTTALADCHNRIENPARVLWRWADAAPRFQDQTKVAGQGAGYWRAASRDFCARRLDADLAGRMESYQAALSRGCKPRSDGKKGLECPAQPITGPGYTPYKVKGDEIVGGSAKGKASVNPGELCREAFAPQGAQLCLAPPGAPALLRPLRPILAPPGAAPAVRPLRPPLSPPAAPAAGGTPAPEPTPSPTPTLTPLRPKILPPGT